MEIEKISHKGKTITKKIKKNGAVSYSAKGVYIGTDKKTGKKVVTTITAKTLKAFDRKLRDKKLEFENNGLTQQKKHKISNFEDLANKWFDNYCLHVQDNTINRVRGYVRNYIIPKFGAYKANEIEPYDIQNWVNELAKNAQKAMSFDTLDKRKGNAQDFGAIAHKLSDIFDFGVTNFGLKSNPAQTVKIPPKPKAHKKRVKVLHSKELAIWLNYTSQLPNNHANRKLKLICDSLLETGVRINELLALTIEDLDFETHQIAINKTLVWRNADKKLGTKGKVICKPTPKTDSGNRKIEVSVSILERLKSWHKETNARFKRQGHEKTSLIFPTVHGNLMCDRNERTALKKHLANAGLPVYGFHLFRHTHASLLLNKGINWKELQVRMGHKSISTTMDLYAELAPQTKIEAVTLLQEELSLLVT